MIKGLQDRMGKMLEEATEMGKMLNQTLNQTAVDIKNMEDSEEKKVLSSSVKTIQEAMKNGDTDSLNRVMQDLKNITNGNPDNNKWHKLL